MNNYKDILIEPKIYCNFFIFYSYSISLDYIAGFYAGEWATSDIILKPIYVAQKKVICMIHFKINYEPSLPLCKQTVVLPLIIFKYTKY